VPLGELPIIPSFTLLAVLEVLQILLLQLRPLVVQGQVVAAETQPLQERQALNLY
jgi:hypothetical protein